AIVLVGVFWEPCWLWWSCSGTWHRPGAGSLRVTRGSGRREGVRARERVDELIGPGPAGGDAKSGSSAAVHDDPGRVEQRVAEPFRFRAGEVAVEAQEFDPREEVLGDEHELHPRGVDREVGGWQVR